MARIQNHQKLVVVTSLMSLAVRSMDPRLSYCMHLQQTGAAGKTVQATMTALP